MSFLQRMASAGGPLYFFDQPTKRLKGRRGGGLCCNEAEAQLRRGQTDGSAAEGDGPPGEARAAAARDHVHAYALLDELARFLSRRDWAAGEARAPAGAGNVLKRSWRDPSAGAVRATSPGQTDGRGEAAEARSRQLSDRREAGAGGPCVGPSVGETQVRSKLPRVTQRKQKSIRAHNSTTVSFSISSNSCKDPGWITQPKQPSSCDEPQPMRLCQWVVERLQAARNPEKLQTAEQDLRRPHILRHYGDAKAKVKHGGIRETRRKAQPATLVNGIPQIPEVKLQDPAWQKLHYRINDGSSFIYYPSGCMAVCQSHSGLPCGGFYTNVFSDNECPVILATITASGHGAVTHPLSSAITAVWDQDGGFIYDHHGNITKEWSWQTDRTMREKIVIQLSDLICVRLLSGTSAMLSFMCNHESVQLPLSALSNINQSKETPRLQTEGRFTSDAAQDLLLARKMLTPVSVCSREDHQMVREVEGLEEPSAQWRRGGHAGRELKRLQRRVVNTLDDWLDYYHVAIGIKCPDMERMPDAPLRTRLRRDVHSAALPSLDPPERADVKPVQPEEGRNELLHRRLSAPAERPLDSYVKLPRTPKKRAKEEACVTQIGPLQIHGNIKFESVIIPNNADLQLSAVTRCPAALLPFTPSAPLTVCPALLRAALLQGEGEGEGERGRRRCCCSATLMPVVTDLEYDSFVMGQPPHSQQMLVVCVSPPLVHTQAVPDQDVLEQLYRRRNKHRTMPCTQCQMDSFRMVRYEISTGKPSCGVENMLLQQRHNVAPGMVLMYIRGKLLFVGFIFRDHSCSVRDLQKQISRTRGDYRLGLSLPSDYMFSDKLNSPAATDAHNSQDAALKGGDDVTLTASEEKANERKKVPELSHHRQRDFCIKPKKTPALPHVAVTTH